MERIELVNERCKRLYLKKGWTTDEVNARLGHKPSSRIIDKYVTYLALDRTRAKKKIFDGSLKKLEIELEKQKEYNKLQSLRMENLQKDNEQLKAEFKLFVEKITGRGKDILKYVNKLEEKEIEIEIKNDT